MKQLKSNLKNLCGKIFGNCTESVQTMIRTDSEHKEKSIFYHAWLSQKAKMMVSGLDKKLSLRASLHDVIMKFMIVKKFNNDAKEACHTRFKSRVETLNIAGGVF